MYNVNDELVIITDNIYPNVRKGEEVRVLAQSDKELLVSNETESFKILKSGLGIQFMVSKIYNPETD